MARLSSAITGEDHIQGALDAPLVLVEYGDFESLKCKQAYAVVKQLQEYFGGDLLFCYRHFPLEDVYPIALPAAETAEWAASHNRFWEMHNLLFEQQEQLSPEMLLQMAGKLELNPEELASALEEGKFLMRVQRDTDSGSKSGVENTPVFYINGAQYTGTYDFEALSNALKGHRQLKAS